MSKRWASKPARHPAALLPSAAPSDATASREYRDAPQSAPSEMKRPAQGGSGSLMHIERIDGFIAATALTPDGYNDCECISGVRKMESPIATYTLGLDIGMASVGAALLADDHIMALHVRAFDKAETAKEGESLNKIRRDARLTRRRIRRRSHRLLRLRRLFKREGIISTDAPSEVTTDVSLATARRGSGPPIDAQGVGGGDLPHRQASGFQSNRKSEAMSDGKAGQMLTGVAANQQRMKQNQWRTVGEMAARDPALRAPNATRTQIQSDVLSQ